MHFCCFLETYLLVHRRSWSNAARTFTIVHPLAPRLSFVSSDSGLCPTGCSRRLRVLVRLGLRPLSKCACGSQRVPLADIDAEDAGDALSPYHGEGECDQSTVVLRPSFARSTKSF